MPGPDSRNLLWLPKVGVIALVVAAYFFVPGVSDFLNSGIAYLRARDYDGLRDFILAYGAWAPVTSILLMTVQSAIPLVPGLALTIANAWIFGWQAGAVYSWIGALCGAMLDFGISRWYGRGPATCFINPRWLDRIDWFFRKYGIAAIFVTRLTPVIPFKIISYGSGLTCMPFWQFAVATGIGQAPAIALYSYIGQNIGRSIRVTLIFTGIITLFGILTYYYRDRLDKYFFPDAEDVETKDE